MDSATRVDDFRARYLQRNFTQEDLEEIAAQLAEAPELENERQRMKHFQTVLKAKLGDVDNTAINGLYMKMLIEETSEENPFHKQFLDYMTKEEEMNEHIINKDKQLFPLPIRFTPEEHSATVIRLLFCPYKEGHKEGQKEAQNNAASNAPSEGGKSGKNRRTPYISISEDAVIKTWDDSFKRKDTVDINGLQQKLRKEDFPQPFLKKMTVSDMVWISDKNMLAIGTQYKNVLFYDVSRPSICGYLVTESRVSVMDYWTNGTKGVFCFADSNGSLFILVSNNIKTLGLFYWITKDRLKGCPSQPVAQLMKHNKSGLCCVKVDAKSEPCCQIRFIQHLDALVTCTRNKCALTKFTLDDKGKPIITTETYPMNCTCIDYSQELLVTGHTDGKVRVWVSFTTEALKVFGGHSQPIRQVFVNKHRIISICEKNICCIWDKDVQFCLQTIWNPTMGSNPTSSVYNPQQNTIVLASLNLGILQGRDTEAFLKAATSHEKPVSCTIYNRIFHQIVSGCKSGVIKVWDIYTGTLVMQFRVIPDQNTSTVAKLARTFNYSAFKDTAITAMSFDESQRRLITASQDEKIRMWNFNNGMLLSEFEYVVTCDVTSLLIANQKIYVSSRKEKTVFVIDMSGNLCETWTDKDLSSSVSGSSTTVPDQSRAEILCQQKSPKDRSKGSKGNQGKNPALAKDNAQKKNTQFKVVCHQTKKNNTTNTWLLTCCGDAEIWVWSTNVDGEPLGKFKAIHDEESFITAMSCQEHILITADNGGRIYLWDIQKYGLAKVSSFSPPLLRSWQGHQKAVATVVYDLANKLIVTAGLDSLIQLWTTSGHCIGTFGKDLWSCADLHNSSSRAESPPMMDFDANMESSPSHSVKVHHKHSKKPGVDLSASFAAKQSKKSAVHSTHSSTPKPPKKPGQAPPPGPAAAKGHPQHNKHNKKNPGQK